MSTQVKCKRPGCPNDALAYPRYDGCCSLYCRDLEERRRDAQRLHDAFRELQRHGRLFGYDTDDIYPSDLNYLYEK